MFLVYITTSERDDERGDVVFSRILVIVIDSPLFVVEINLVCRNVIVVAGEVDCSKSPCFVVFVVEFSNF